MKILLLLSRCDQTGVTTHTIDLSEALVQQGHDVTVLIGRNMGGASSRKRDALPKIH